MNETLSEPIRLDKRLAELLGCSRAHAQKYIEGGWVTVDGVVVEECQARIAATQRVELLEHARLSDTLPATLLLHKPVGVATAEAAQLASAATHASDDSSGVRMLKRHFQHLTPLMPLDTDASGLLVLSQDERARRRLTEDAASIEQEFVVEISGQIAPYGLARLREGLRYLGRVLPACKVSWQSEQRLRFALKNVQPGQLRQMCSDVGLTVLAIRRLRLGREALSKLPVGEWRYLSPAEKF